MKRLTRAGALGAWWCCGVLLLAGPAGVARAADGGAGGDDNLFDKGTWTLQLTGGYYNDFTFESDEVFGVGSIGVGYHFWDDFSFNLNLDGYYLETQLEPGGFAGAGLTVLARWHFLGVGDRLTFFIEGGAGAVWAGEQIPDFGTHFNFTPQAGLGVTVRLDEHLHLFGGPRYFHLSNANRKGGDENPGVDAIGGFVGVLWTF